MKFTSALLCIARDEDHYIDEWISYHLKLGFDAIYIIQNNWLYKGKFVNNSQIHLLINNGIFNCFTTQVEWYNDILKNIFSMYNFIGIWDVDEFIVLKKQTLQQFFYDNKTQPILFIKWRIFGDSNLTAFNKNNTSVLKRFIYCDKSLHSNGKSIINTMITDFNTYKLKTVHNFEYIPTHTFIKYVPLNAEIFHYRNKTRIERYQRLQGKSDFDKLFETYNKNDILNIDARKYMYGY